MRRVPEDRNTKARHMAHVLVTTYDGTADEADRDLLRSFVAHPPASGLAPGVADGE